MDLRLLDATFSVCRLEPGAALVIPPEDRTLWSVTRTADETSVICEQGMEPSGATVEPGWRGAVVEGPLEFSMVGVLADLTRATADAGVSVFALSTYDTDYLLFKADNLARAVVALEGNGHRVTVS